MTPVFPAWRSRRAVLLNSSETKKAAALSATLRIPQDSGVAIGPSLDQERKQRGAPRPQLIQVPCQLRKND
jgi:hypothetical protein